MKEFTLAAAKERVAKTLGLSPETAEILLKKAQEEIANAKKRKIDLNFAGLGVDLEKTRPIVRPRLEHPLQP